MLGQPTRANPCRSTNVRNQHVCRLPAPLSRAVTLKHSLYTTCSQAPARRTYCFSKKRCIVVAATPPQETEETPASAPQTNRASLGPPSANEQLVQPRTGAVQAGTSGTPQSAPSTPPKRLPMPPTVRDPEQWAIYIDEYSGLKESLLNRTRQAGSVMALYVLFALDGKGSLCTLLGTSFSYLYLMWLFYDIDTLNYANPRLMMKNQRFSIFSVLVKAFAAYQQALKPRLLVPVAAAALFATVNAKIGSVPLVYEGCLLAGFLAYKFALLYLLLDELQLKRAEEEESYRPSIAAVDDELDVYGRPKPRVASPIEGLPPEMQAAAESELAKTVTKNLENS